MQLHFREYGHGAPLIILHGLFGSLHNWQTISRKLAAQYHVFTLDQRNHGDSPHNAEMNYALMAGDVREFADTRSLHAAHVLGHSLGGKTAMQFAMSFPERVLKLIVADMAPRAYEPIHDYILNALHSLDLRSFQTRGEIDRALSASIPERAVRQFLLKNLRNGPDDGLEWKLNLANISRNYPELNAAVHADRPFTRPALFIRGSRSDYVRDRDLPVIKHLFPAARFETIPDAGHWLHSEAPDAFVQIVRRFLEGTVDST